MKDLKILNDGFKDLLNPMSEEEMSFLLGGAADSVSCKKGYTSMECKCGYQGPAFIKTYEPGERRVFWNLE